jgi:hypothetical protein
MKISRSISAFEIDDYIEEGKRITQEVFDMLTPYEVQIYFKANMMKNGLLLDLSLLTFLPNGIKFPDGCVCANLCRLEALPENIKAPESFECMLVSNKAYLPLDVLEPRNYQIRFIL